MNDNNCTANSNTRFKGKLKLNVCFAEIGMSVSHTRVRSGPILYYYIIGTGISHTYDWWTTLIADPPDANSTTDHCRPEPPAAVLKKRLGMR